MGFVGHYDDVRALRENRVRAAIAGVEFMDKGEDVAVIFAQEHFQTLAAGGSNCPLGFGDCAGSREILIDLAVEFIAVGDDDKGPIARQLAQHLLGENSIE